MDKIVLNQKDFLGRGACAPVYRYVIENTPLVVKCFKSEAEANQEK